MVPQGLPPSAKKQLVKVGEFDIDGIKDFIVCTNDVITEMKYGEKNDKHIVVPINDPHITTKNLEFKIVYKKESLYLTHKLFNYEVSNGVFMKLHQEEEYPLSAGSVF
jgi:serine/threonine protein phosphatase PrpC